MKKKMLFIIVLMLFISNVKGLTYQGCSYSSISRLKSLVKNIDITYDYHINNGLAYFNVTMTNIQPNMYFVDTITGTEYNYSNTNNGEITLTDYTNTNGGFKFYSSLSECYGTNLGVKYYSFPNYNVYYNDPMCYGIEDYALCKKWVKTNYNYLEFEKKSNGI